MDSNNSVNEKIIEQFESLWNAGTEPDLAGTLAEVASAQYLATLEELIIIDLEFRWKRLVPKFDLETLIPPAGIESYVLRFPELEREDIVARLAREEFIIRRRYGDGPTVAMFAARFPQLEQDFQQLSEEYPAAPRTVRGEFDHNRNDQSETDLPNAATPVVNNYQIRRQLGEGGMGSVYLAEQQQPVRRSVALKVIRGGILSRDIIARFEAERQALAMMDHQNIAKVLDGGVTVDGQPFYAMELVDGTALTDFCEQRQASLDERLELFLQTCRAVQHAHQRGILHRDLKPSNILVTMDDDRPMVKVIDFGLAKALQQSTVLTDRSLNTQIGQIVGTPQYMSPEQCGSDPNDVDTRSDVYALGAVLYELLTGSPPLEKDQLQAVAMDEVMRTIRERDPERPSSRVTRVNAADDSSVGSLSRGRLRNVLKGELDWIVMRSLEKDRERRYESPLSLAQDLQRFQRHEPVEAGPPSATYRIAKFTRRHAVPMAAAAASLALLMVSAVLIGFFGLRAIASEQKAIQNEAVAKKLAVKSQQEAASLALRQAESAMSSQDIPRGLQWYLSALETAPDSEQGIQRVARKNLAAWSKLMLKPVRSKTLEFVHAGYYVDEMPIEQIEDRLLCRFKIVTDETHPSEAEKINELLGETNTGETQYSLLNEDDFSDAIPPFRPLGNYLKHWIDASGQRLITLHVISDEQATDEAESPAALGDGRSDSRPLSYDPPSWRESGELIVQQWSLETGAELAAPIRFRGSTNTRGVGLFQTSGIQMDIQGDRMLHFDDRSQLMHLWSLQTGAELCEPLSCLGADWNLHERRIAVLPSDGGIAIYRLDSNGVQLIDQIDTGPTFLAVKYSESLFLPSQGGVMAVDDQRQVHFWNSQGKHFATRVDAAVRGITAAKSAIFIGLSYSGIVRWDYVQDETRLLNGFNQSSAQLDVFDHERYVAVFNEQELKVWDTQLSVDEPVYRATGIHQSNQFQYSTSFHVDDGNQLINASFEAGGERFFTWDNGQLSQGKQFREVPLDSADNTFSNFFTYDSETRLLSCATQRGRSSCYDASTGGLTGLITGLSHREVVLPVGLKSSNDALLVLSMPASKIGKVHLHHVKIRGTRLGLPRQSIQSTRIKLHPNQDVGLLSLPWQNAMSATGDHIVGINPRDQRIEIYEFQTGEKLELDQPTPTVTWEQVSPATRGPYFLATSQSEQKMQLWDAHVGKPIGPILDLAVPGDTIDPEIDWSTDLTHAIFRGRHSIVNLQDGVSRRLPIGTDVEILLSAFSPDDKIIAIMLGDERVQLYDAASLKLLAEKRIDEDLLDLNFASNQMLIGLTAGMRWFKFDLDLNESEGGVYSASPLDVRFTPDRSEFAMALDDNTLQVWDVATGRKIGPAKRLPGAYIDMDFRKDGKVLCVISEPEISVFNIEQETSLSTDQLRRQLESLERRDLDEDEELEPTAVQHLSGGRSPDDPFGVELWLAPPPNQNHSWPIQVWPRSN